MVESRVARGSVLLCVTVLALAASPASASDDKDQFAVRGAALINCAAFTQARATRSDVYSVVASWVDGYVTGINQYADKTYDALSFEGTELLMAVLDEHCKTHPKDPVFGVINSLLRKLWPDRVTGKSDKVVVATGGRQASHYAELVKRMQQALLTQGYYKGPVSGEFSPPTVAAVKRFQKSIGFEQTGFPDQTTLWRLLRDKDMRPKK